MKQLTIGLVQPKVFYHPKKSFEENDEINYRHALKHLKGFKKNEVDLIVFPEFYPGNVTYQIGKLKELHEEAKRLNSYILCGEFERFGKKMYNSETLISPRGKIVGRYHKIKLWFDEAKYGVAPGKSLKIFNIKGVKVGILTCYDLAHIDLVKKMKELGAEIIVNPSQIVPAYLTLWKYDAVSLANNYRLPIACINCCLYMGANGKPYGGGKSKIVLPSNVNLSKLIKPINVNKFVTKKLGSKEGILRYTIKVKQ